MTGVRERKRVARKRGRTPARGAAMAALPDGQHTGRRGRPAVPYFKYRAHCTERRVMVWLRYGGASFMEIVAGTNRNKNSVAYAITTLVRAGVVRRLRPGWYELANTQEFFQNP